MSPIVAWMADAPYDDAQNPVIREQVDLAIGPYQGLLPEEVVQNFGGMLDPMRGGSGRARLVGMRPKRLGRVQPPASSHAQSPCG